MKLGVFGPLEFVFLLIAIAVIAAGLVAIEMFIDLGREKGHKLENTSVLWFIGICCSPIVLGLYIAALPDKRLRADSNDISQDLPSL